MVCRDDEIARMLQESFANAAPDMVARALAEARVEAERIVDATEAALRSDGDLLERRGTDRRSNRRLPRSAGSPARTTTTRSLDAVSALNARPRNSPPAAWTAASDVR